MIYKLMRIIPVIIRQLKINLQVKSDPLIYRKLTKSANMSKYPIYLLASPLALRPLAIYIFSSGEFSILPQRWL